MKKRVLCFLVLVLYLLTACTMLSSKIEEEMATEVTVYQVEAKEAGRYEINLPVRFLFLEDEQINIDDLGTRQLGGLQDYTLYQLEQRKGWESGLRVWEVDRGDYHINPMDSVLSGFDETRPWTFVSCASRHPRPGQAVRVLPDGEIGRDHYLVLYPGIVPTPDRLPEGVTIAAKNDHALLLAMERVPVPFLEKQAKTQLGILRTTGCRVFSLHDLDQLLSNLPDLALVGILLAAALILWVQAYRHLENRWLLIANAVLGAGSLVVLYWILHWIDLPSSLLPPENILDFGHYSRTLPPLFDALRFFSRDLFATLRALGKTGQNTLNLLYCTTRQMKTMALLASGFTVLWLSLPYWLIRDSK